MKNPLTLTKSDPVDVEAIEAGETNGYVEDISTIQTAEPLDLERSATKTESIKTKAVKSKSARTPAGHKFPKRLMPRYNITSEISKYPEQPFDPRDIQEFGARLFSNDPKTVTDWLERVLIRPQDRSIGFGHRAMIANPTQEFLDHYSYTPIKWTSDDGKFIRRPLREEADYRNGHLAHIKGGWGNARVIGWNTALVGNQGLDMKAEEERYAKICAMRGVDYSNVAIPYPEQVAWLQQMAKESQYRVVKERNYSSPYSSDQRSPCVFYNPVSQSYEAYPENSVASSAAQIAQMMHDYLGREQDALDSGGNTEVALKYLFHSLIGGPPRSGKTTFTDGLANNLGLPRVKAGLTKHSGESLASDGLFGRTLMHGNSSEFILSNVAYAYMCGGIVLMDEVTNLTENAKAQLRSILSADETQIVLEGIPDYDFNGRVLLRHPAFYIVSTYNPGGTVEVPTDHNIALLQDRSNSNIPLNSHYYDLYDESFSAEALRTQIADGVAEQDFMGTYACVLFAEFIDNLRKIHDPLNRKKGNKDNIFFPQQPTFGHAVEFFNAENLETALRVFPYYRDMRQDRETTARMVKLFRSTFWRSLEGLLEQLQKMSGAQAREAAQQLRADMDYAQQKQGGFRMASAIFDMMRKDMLGDRFQTVPLYLQNSVYLGKSGVKLDS